MANKTWVGGTTPVAQVSTLTPGGTIEAGDVFNVILTDENGTATTVAVTATGTSVAQTVADIVSACGSSTNSLFTALTWTDSTSLVTVTAKSPGVPFYLTETTTESGGGSADNQTFAVATTTANAGPTDWNTAANWDGSGVPSSGDAVFIVAKAGEPSYDIRYGLDQSAVQIESLEVSPSWKGRMIGDPENNFYLKISVDHSSPKTTIINTETAKVWLYGTMETVNVIGTTSGLTAVKLNGDIDNLRVLGDKAIGRITVADSATLDNVYMTASRAEVYVGTSVSSLDLVEMTAGYMELASTAGASGQINLAGGTLRLIEGTANKIEVRGGTLSYESNDDLDDGSSPTMTVFDGTVDFTKNMAAPTLTITLLVQYGGLVTDDSNLGNLAVSTYTQYSGKKRI
jgi:hypothetical protein